jgi:hypothetical protein
MLILLFQTISACYFTTVLFANAMYENACVKFVCDGYCSFYKTVINSIFGIRVEPTEYPWSNISYLAMELEAESCCCGCGKLFCSCNITYNIVASNYKELYVHEDVKNEDTFLNELFESKENHEQPTKECLMIHKFDRDHTIYNIIPLDRCKEEQSSAELPLDASSMKKSSMWFLSIEYTHPKLSKPIYLDIPRNVYMVGNVILSPTFVARYLAYNYGTGMFNVFYPDYKLTIIDKNVEIITLHGNQCIKILEDGYMIRSV